MAAPYSVGSAAGSTKSYWAFVGTDGYQYGTTGTTLANGSGSGMGRINGVTSVAIEEPETRTVNFPGDNGSAGQIEIQPETLPAGTLTTSLHDADFAAAVSGLKLRTLGTQIELLQGAPACLQASELCILVNSPGIIKDGTTTLKGYRTVIYYRALTSQPRPQSLDTGAATTWVSKVVLNLAGTFPWGTALTSATDGTTQAAYFTMTTPYEWTQHAWQANGSGTTFTLDETPAVASGDYCLVWRNGTPLTYTTDYTVNTSTKVVTLVSAGTAADKIRVLYAMAATC